ncbi:hypothetical protein [Pseudobacillus wudalianchiensis]|uniref:Transporter n=1 Tax=Pseudobacillus wudalianchiensis TaxID=1743143 RepID=A0A1B9AZH5_9BACI|nr:hypothetical protein [Bacillus wudalianchiensis]OCA89153.1 hypothetical protein A8F95_05560 [Bacillus wudalianchiensis]
MLYDVPIDRLQGQGFPGIFGPPGGFPSSPSIPSVPPPGVPGGGQQAGGPPSSPPPAFTPQLQQGAISPLAVDPGAIRGCLFRYTYVWLENGQNFWFYPIFVGRTSIAGWRWQNWRWVYFGTDLRRIRSFQCF